MRTSEQINELAAALAKAQGEIAPAPKEKTNPHFKNRYADLSNIMDVARGPLAKNGLSLIQPLSTNFEHGTVIITTRLMHASGQWLEDDLEMVPKDMSPQAVGSVITYGRRYATASILSIVSEEDDDGHAAQAPQPFRGPRQAPKPQAPRTSPLARDEDYGRQPLDDGPDDDIYIGTPDQQKRAAEYMTKAKLPEERWERVHQLLSGRRFDKASLISAVATAFKETKTGRQRAVDNAVDQVEA